MSYYKSDYHEELNKKFIRALKSVELEYACFSYVASAIEKKDVLSALSDHSIDFDILLDISSKWSGSERAMLEVAIQLFNGGNLYVNDEDDLTFTSITSIFNRLDEKNSKVVLEATTKRFAF